MNNKQIQLIQIAAKEAGLRGNRFEGRYRMLLGQFIRPDKSKVTSCKQLNNLQFEEFLAICESMGFRCKGKSPTHFRDRVENRGHYASPQQKAAIEHLAGDIGWSIDNLNAFVKKTTDGQIASVAVIKPKQAWMVIEALKNILSKKTGRSYANLKEVTEDFTQEAKDGKAHQTIR